MTPKTAIAWLHYLTVEFSHDTHIREALRLAIETLREKDDTDAEDIKSDEGTGADPGDSGKVQQIRRPAWPEG